MRVPVCLARITQSKVGMITGTLRIVPAPSRRGDVLEVLRSVQGPVLAQPGCAAFHIYEEQGPENAVVTVERWESPAALEAHIRSLAFSRILGAIELSDRQPEITFDHVSASEGMEMIVRSRISGATTSRGVRPAGIDEATDVNKS